MVVVKRRNSMVSHSKISQKDLSGKCLGCLTQEYAYVDQNFVTPTLPYRPIICDPPVWDDGVH